MPTDDQKRLSGLFQFAEGILRAKDKVIYQMADTGLGIFLPGEITGLPGVALDAEDDCWLKVQRLRESAPEKPPAELAEWLDGNCNDPDSAPKYLDFIAHEVTIDEASELCEAQIVSLEDIHVIRPGGLEKTIDGGTYPTVRILLRLENLPSVREALDAWKQKVWDHWAKHERPLRASIRLYNNLYKLYNMLHGGAAAKPPELVWGIGLARWRLPAQVVDLPLIEQLVDLELQAGGTLVLRPRQVAPTIGIRAFLELNITGGQETQSALQKGFELVQANNDFEITPFAPSVWEHLLDTAAGQLSAKGRHVSYQALANGETIDPPGPELRLYSTWAIYARPRSENLRSEDLQRLRQKIEEIDDEQLLDSLRGYIAPPPDPSTLDDDPFGLTTNVLGVSGSSTPVQHPTVEPVPTGKAIRHQVYFFPLPFNDEQSRIIDLLNENQVGVVSVTGPPGTGKTHSIANIIGHYMATGRRVLVTARTAEAIAAVRSKLPEELADLIIASVGSDREATKQLEAAAQRLLDDVVSLDQRQAKDKRDQLEHEIIRLDDEMIACDAQLARIAEANLSKLDYHGSSYSPMELAERLNKDAPLYQWLTDRPNAPPPTTLAAAIERLRQLLPQLGDDLVYLDTTLPQAGSLPSAAELIEAHQSELRRRQNPPEDCFDVPAMARDTEKAEFLARQVEGMLQQISRALDEGAGWQDALFRHCMQHPDQGLNTLGIVDAVERVSTLLHNRAPGRLELEVDRVDTERLLEVASRASQGRTPLTFSERLFSRALGATVANLRINGAPPVNRDDWQMVCDTLSIIQARAKIEAHWHPYVETGYLPPLPEAPDDLVQVVGRVKDWLPLLRQQAKQLSMQAPVLKQLFPCGIEIDDHLATLNLRPLLRALQANLREVQPLPEALTQLQVIGEQGTQPLYANIRGLAEAIGADYIQPAAIITARNAITDEINRLQALKASLTEVQQDLEELHTAGAPNWAASCLSAPGDIDQTLPSEWLNAWHWAILRQRVDDIIALGNGNDWRDKKSELLHRRERLLASLIRVRTLLGLKQRMTPSVQSALHRFTSAVRRIGQGTGMSAPRLRKAARQAAAEAAQAAPVWIMPEHKVVEQLPAELGNFDLVILDEASQSDVTALSALARGKKHLIVGDEQQVSPSAVGIPQNKIDYLRAEHLKNLPSREVIDEKTSIFEIAMQMWPQTHLMLREHFRCVEPIIQFSTRFYHNRLIPIRVPKASERFDPPLVDIFIKGGERRGKQNEHEAQVIVEEIARLIQDPSHAKRDIGVISLIGNDQAQRIEQLLLQHPDIGPAVMERHGILCGDSRTMQGRERSIIFLSMVAAPGQAKLQNTREDSQRFNVALSRARDRLYLVRSVAAQDLKEGDLKLDVVRHFADPMPEGRRYPGTSILEQCESGFERAVCTRLLDANYRVRAQVQVGPYRIDLVVEGADDRRLAIELDGDHWHGSEQWGYDMARQATLERAGWTFWRVFGSQWMTNSEYWWQHLLQRLETIGIEPIGADAREEVFTEHREVDVSHGAKNGLASSHPATITVNPLPTETPSATREDSQDSIPSDRAEIEGVEPEPALADLLSTSETATNAYSSKFNRPGSELKPMLSAVTETAPSKPSEAHGVVIPFRLTHPAAEIAITPTRVKSRSHGNPAFPDTSRFYDSDYKHQLRGMACQLIDQRGPISFTHLCTLIARQHGFKRTGPEIRKTIHQALGKSRLHSHGTGERAVFWPEHSQPSEWVEFRGIGEGEEKRHWDDVPEPEKLGLALKIIAQECVDPELAMRDTIGISRMGHRLRDEFTALLRRAKEIQEHGIDKSVNYLHG